MNTTLQAQSLDRKQDKRPSLTLVVGLIMLLGGVGTLSWVAWQYWGTNIVAKKEHERIRTDIRSNWDKNITPASGAGLLHIPSFGTKYEIPIVDGDDAAALSKGVGRHQPSAAPGQIGNLVLSGHRVTHGEPFRRFMELKAGDMVVVETKDFLYTYILRNDASATRVPFTTSWPLGAVPDPDPAIASVAPTKAVITLVTCSELFHTDYRNVVIGDLDQTERK